MYADGGPEVFDCSYFLLESKQSLQGKELTEFEMLLRDSQ